MKASKANRTGDWVTRQLADAGVRLSFEQERAAHEFIEQLEVVLEESGISRAELARRLKRSAPSITQALRKGRNLTIKLMAELAGACDHELHVRLRHRNAEGGPIYVTPEKDWAATLLSQPSVCHLLYESPTANRTYGDAVPDPCVLFVNLGERRATWEHPETFRDMASDVGLLS